MTLTTETCPVVKFLGADMSVRVTAKVQIGDTTFEDWGTYNDPNIGNIEGASGLPDISAGLTSADTDINVFGSSWYDSGSRIMEIDSSSNGHGQNVWVLKDGDDVPTVQGLNDQLDLALYLSAYISDGKIALASNEIIYVYELGTTNMSSTAADFQDLVVLISFEECP